MMSKTAIFIAIVALVLTACIKIENEPYTPAPSFEDHKDLATKSVIIIVIDGARYSETWGDSTHQYIPFLANFLARYGVVCTQFYNQGVTKYPNGSHSNLHRQLSRNQQRWHSNSTISIHISVL